jgi:uncharacterized protein YecT (DUF1311 family)
MHKLELLGLCHLRHQQVGPLIGISDGGRRCMTNYGGVTASQSKEEAWRKKPHAPGNSRHRSEAHWLAAFDGAKAVLRKIAFLRRDKKKGSPSIRRKTLFQDWLAPDCRLAFNTGVTVRGWRENGGLSDRVTGETEKQRLGLEVSSMRMVWLVLLISGGVGARGASFDCTKAATPQEKAICASPKLSAEDEQMAAAYKAVLAAAPAEMKAEVLEGQRTWIRGQALACKPTGTGQDLSACLEGYEEARTKALQHMVLREGGVTFVWRSITLKAPDGPDDVAPGMRQYEANAGFGTLNAEWPQANDPSPEWRAWNSAIELAARELTSQNSSGPAARPPEKWAATGGVDESLTTSLGILDADLVTAEIENFWDGHGAHPNTLTTQFNWLLKEKHELRAEDVFRHGSGWDLFLQKRCDQYLHKKLDSAGNSYEDFEQPGEMAKTLRGIVIEPKNWQLDAKGITIIFQPYAVACYACTPPPVTIAWQDLKPLVQSTFAVPRSVSSSKAASSE